MSRPGDAWQPGKPGYGTRDRVALILGAAICHTCLNRLGSRLHHELCEVGA